jgi:uncharacterized membrane-anchored protein
LFAVVFAIPAVGWRLLSWNSVFAFWFAYVITRPLGASVADYLSKPKNISGAGFGDGRMAVIFTVAVAIGVAYLSVARNDIQQPQPEAAAPRPHAHRR